MLIASAAAFAALAWSSQGRLGPLWDEVVDLRIAEAYLADPLRGSGLDGSQTRLPMAVNALVSAIAGPSLAVSRMISVVVGAGAVVAAWLLARRLFGGWAAMLAAGLLALSPYFLAFGRIGMTEGDVFPALLVTLAVWSYARFVEARTGPRLAVLSVLVGLAIAAKLYALFLIPVIALCEWTHARSRVGRLGEAQANRGDDSAALPAASVGPVGGGLVVLGMLLLAACIGLAQSGRPSVAVPAWAVMAACAVALAVWMVCHRRTEFGPMWAWVLTTVLAGLVCASAFPEHVLNPEIVRTVARRTVSWDDRLPGTLLVNHIRLYSGIVLVFATPAVGLAVVGSIVWAWVRETDRPELRLSVFGVSFFVIALTTLPLRQTFYLMTVWPLLMVLAAGGLVRARTWLGRRRASLGRAGTLGILLVVAQLGFAAGSGWPDYNLYARRWVGSRWLGAESRGYRNLVQTPCDGYAELVGWCLENVGPGQTVVSYLWADHVLDMLLPEEMPFRLVRRGVYAAANRGEPPPPAPSIEEADVVLLHLNNRVEYEDRPPQDVLERRFGGRPALAVLRDGDLVLATIHVARVP